MPIRGRRMLQWPLPRSVPRRPAARSPELPVLVPQRGGSPGRPDDLLSLRRSLLLQRRWAGHDLLWRGLHVRRGEPLHVIRPGDAKGMIMEKEMFDAFTRQLTGASSTRRQAL